MSSSKSIIAISVQESKPERLFKPWLVCGHLLLIAPSLCSTRERSVENQSYSPTGTSSRFLGVSGQPLASKANRLRIAFRGSWRKVKAPLLPSMLRCGTRLGLWPAGLMTPALVISIKHSLDGFKKQIALLALTSNLCSGGPAHRLRNKSEGFASCSLRSEHLMHARTFQVI